MLEIKTTLSPGHSIRNSGYLTFLLCLTLSVLGINAPARAAALSWDNSAADGLAATAANWTPAQIPVAADDLTFNIAVAYPVTWGATVTSSDTHTYRQGTVTNTMSSDHSVSTGITIGDTNALAATMTLTTGTMTSNGSVVVGSIAGSTGTLNVDDDDAELIIAGATSDLTIGNSGDAAMSITGFGRVEVADQFVAGSNNGSTPIITVSGFALFLGSSTLNVLGTGTASRIGAGGDATMTVSNGALAHFAGDLIIANGSLSTSSVTVQTASLINASLTVDGDLLIGRNISAATPAGTGELEINTGGTATVGGDTLVGDPDGGSGTILLGGGTFTGALPVQLLTLSSIFGFGTVNADVTVGPGSIVATTAAGLTLNGIVNCTTFGVSGTKVHFGPSGGYLGSGTCDADITGDVASTITATGPLTIGNATISGFFYLGTLAVGTQNVTLVDSNGPIIGGLATMSSGGQFSGTSPIGVQAGGRVQGQGTIVGNVTASGVLDPQRSPTPGGIMNITGNLLMNAGGEYDMEIGGTPASNMHDRLNVSGTATFDGTLRVTIPNGYVPKVGEQFIAINATGGRIGEFATIIEPSLPCNEVTFVMVYSSTAAIVLIRPPLGCTSLGDLNSDGGCSGKDMQEFVNSMILGPYNSCADMNGNCINDPLDIPIFVNCLL
jgi:T5SS/PEP-CTERM-associated repeat protein